MADSRASSNTLQFGSTVEHITNTLPGFMLAAQPGVTPSPNSTAPVWAALTTTDITLAAPAAGSMKYDHDDPSWSGSTIPNAMALVEYFLVGSAGTDMLLHLLDFVTAVSTTSGLLLVQLAAGGVWNLDHVA